MILMLFALLLVAGMAFMLFNTGRQLERRIATQHAADAAAHGGAGSVARAFNTIAMNNVTTARVIAAIAVLDALPMAVDLTLTAPAGQGMTEPEAVRAAARSELRAGVTDAWFDRMLRDLLGPDASREAAQREASLRALHDLFRRRPDLLSGATRYVPTRDAARQAGLWQAMFSLDAVSRAAADELHRLAQRTADELGRAELSSAGQAWLLPGHADAMVLRRGVFDDYERPVKHGLLPGADRRTPLAADDLTRGFGVVDHPEFRRGPFDTLFGWRRAAADDRPDTPTAPWADPPTPSPPAGSPDGAAYQVYGPFDWLIRKIPTSPYDRLRDRVDTLARIKLGYLWAGGDARDVVAPGWEVDILYDDERSTDAGDRYARGLPTDEIRETMFLVGEIKSRVADDRGLAENCGRTWNTIDRTTGDAPHLLVVPGWHDPADGPPVDLATTGSIRWRHVGGHVWRLSATYRTDPTGPDRGGDPSIGLDPRPSLDGFAAQTVYWEIDFLLVGVNTGPRLTVANPFADFDRTAPDAPAPIDLDHDRLEPLNSTRTRRFDFLAVARQPNDSALWPSLFDRARVSEHMTALAQAVVFNDHSADLWTQAWRVRLEPVRDIDEWVGVAASALDNEPLMPGVDRRDREAIDDALRAIEPLSAFLFTDPAGETR